MYRDRSSFANDVGQHAVDVKPASIAIDFSSSSGASNETSSSSFSMTVWEGDVRRCFSVSLVHDRGEVGDPIDRSRVEPDADSFGRHQRDVLGDERTLRLGENPHEVFFFERLELNPNRKASLQLRDQVGRLRRMEGPGGNEQDMVGADHTVLGVDRRPLR